MNKELGNIMASFLAISVDNFIDPITYFNAWVIEVQNYYIDCNNNLILKQMNTRFSEWSGFIQLLFDIGYPFVGLIAPGEFWESEMYDPMMELYDNILDSDTNPLTCEQMGIDYGRLVSGLFVFDAPEEVYYSDLPVDLEYE